MCDADQIKPVNPKGNQPWIVTGRTGAKAETPILFPPDAKSQVTGKHPYAGKARSQEKKGMTGWDGWMASPTQWTWVWASYGRWWRRGKPSVLQSMGVANSRTQLSEWTATMWCWYVNKQIIQGMEIKQMQRNRISTTEIDSNTCRNLMYDKEDN